MWLADQIFVLTSHWRDNMRQHDNPSPIICRPLKDLILLIHLNGIRRRRRFSDIRSVETWQHTRTAGHCHVYFPLPEVTRPGYQHTRGNLCGCQWLATIVSAEGRLIKIWYVPLYSINKVPQCLFSLHQLSRITLLVSDSSQTTTFALATCAGEVGPSIARS